MKESDFQFTDPCLIHMNFRENKDFTIESGREVKINTNIEVNQQRINDNEAVVSILINLGSEENSVPFSLEAEFVAQFRWGQAFNSNTVDSLLKQNAPALLLSYARPIISMITNASHFPAFNIPFFNFKEDEGV